MSGFVRRGNKYASIDNEGRYLRAPHFLLITLLTIGLVSMTPQLGSDRIQRLIADRLPTAGPEKTAPAPLEIPATFLPNQGQIEGKVEFYSSSAGYSFYLSKTEATYAFLKENGDQKPLPSGNRSRGAESKETIGEAYALKVRFLGANPEVAMVGGDRLPGEVNYFIGNDPSRWVTNVATYDAVTYENIYDGIDLTYSGDSGKIKYEFVVAPGADLSNIRLGYSGADSLRLDKKGNLLIGTPWGDLQDDRPLVYQLVGFKRVARDAAFSIDKSMVGFSVPTYDHSLPLYIDPTLSYSGFIGGSSLDWAEDVAVDDSGNSYVTGYTLSTSGFPTTAGAYDITRDAKDAFLTKIDPSGTTILYSTYFGGSFNESGWGVTVDESGTVYLTGQTGSTDFPTTAGAYSTSLGGSYDAFVLKLDPGGNGVADLLYSSYMGGLGLDSANDIVVDSSKTIHFVGGTASSNFPTSAGAYDTGHNGDVDAFIARIDPAGGAAGDLLYSTVFGTAGEEFGTSLALDSSGTVHLTGKTSSAVFPTTAGAFDTVYSGNVYDAFVAKLDPAGGGSADLIYSSYLGGGGSDEGAAIALHDGNIIVTGNTTSNVDFPLTAGAYDVTHNGGTDVFISKINPAGSGSSDLLYSSYIGGGDADNGLAIAVDVSGVAYITGRAQAGFPTVSGPIDDSHNGGSDVFVARLSMLGTGSADLLYSTYLGGTLTEYANGIALDSAKNVYLAGYTASSAFPTTGGVFDSTYGGVGDAFAVKMDIIPPTTTTIVGYTPASDQISLFWPPTTDTVGVAGYKIFNADTSVELADTVDTSYTFSGLSSLVTYAYYLKAYDPSGNYSAASNTIRMMPGISTETSAGVDLTVNPLTDVSLTFSEVLSAGETSITKSASPGPPAGFEFDDYHYDIQTDASYVPPITVAISYDESEITGPEEDLKMMHYDGAWEDVTLYVDTVNNIIVGQVNSFSVIAMVWASSGSPAPATGFDSFSLFILAVLCLMAGSGALLPALKKQT